MYEFLTTGAFVAVAVFLPALIRRDLRFLGTFVLGLAIIMQVAASVAYWTPVGHLVPALQSYWLIIHVSIAVLSSALFTLTFAMSAVQLVQSHRQKAVAAGGADKPAFMRLVPSALSLENLSYRINALGFLGWTLHPHVRCHLGRKGLGRFWGWDTKEVWTFVIWVVYAGYLHARATRGWTGTRAAWLSIVGYLCVVFNFTIVNQFFNRRTHLDPGERGLLSASVGHTGCTAAQRQVKGRPNERRPGHHKLKVMGSGNLTNPRKRERKMSHRTTHTLLDAYPKDLGSIDQHKLAECISACFDCSQACTACADACLSEDMVAELTKCIRTDLDCADVCTTTGNVLSRHTGYDANVTRAVLQACAILCKTCGDECDQHASMHEHCRICAEACRRCETACNELLASLG